MPGFRVPKKIYNLSFEDPEWEGLIVKAQEVDVNKMFAILDLAKLQNLSDNPMDLDPEDVEDIKDLFPLLADLVVEWNIEDDDGNPVPTTVEGVKSLKFGFAFSLLMEAVGAVMDVEVPLGQPSTSGAPSVDQQDIPMVLSSKNQAA